MNRSAFPIALAAAAMLASVAAAQTPDPHHTGTPAGSPAAMTPMAPPQAGMPMPMPMPGGGMANGGMMGGDMGRMMEAMHPMMPGGMGMPFEHIEGRIAYLKAELNITDAQAAPWTAYADTMRSNAAAMKAMHDSMGAMGVPAKPTTTPDRMAARRKMMTTHMAMMDHSEASMKALYAALSPQQRTVFDQVMAGPMGTM